MTLLKELSSRTESGRQAILSKMVVDATGDGDVAALAGAPYEKSVGRLLPMSFDWRIANADFDRALPVLKDRANMNRLIKESIDKEELPYIPALRVLPEQGNQTATINASMFNYKAGPIKWHRKGEISAWGPHIQAVGAVADLSPS